MPRKMAREPKTITSQSDCPDETANPPAVPAKASKIDLVRTLLEREGGATLAEMIAATDWLPHTTRAALTGLRKKGHVIERSKRGEESCYRIALSAS